MNDFHVLRYISDGNVKIMEVSIFIQTLCCVNPTRFMSHITDLRMYRDLGKKDFQKRIFTTYLRKL